MQVFPSTLKRPTPPMVMMTATCAVLTILLAVSLTPWGSAVADDRHAGYYYPENVTHETYVARARTLQGSTRERRIAFVTGVTAQQVREPYPPVTAMFAKGERAQKLILVSLSEGRLNTLYRVRAVLAMLTASARTTPVFADLDAGVEYTFLDLLKILGFEQITVSDGDTFAHQIKIE
jgi:hypothetical protein